MPVTTEATAFHASLASRSRRLAVRDAGRALAAAIGDRSAAQAAFDEAGRAVSSAQDRVSRSSTDEAVEAFAAWLPEGRRALRHAGANLERAELLAAGARAALHLARAVSADAGGPRWPISPQSRGILRPGLAGAAGAGPSVGRPSVDGPSVGGPTS